MAYIKAYNVGTVVKLYDSGRSKRSEGLVKMDSTGDLLEFKGLLSLTEKDIGKTKIAGTILRGDNRKPIRMIRIKRWWKI